MKLIELHILQSFPVSCLNRDDVGAPKSATFGGVPRARLSSQCLKRAIREYAQNNLPDARFGGVRGRFVVNPLTKALTEVFRELEITDASPRDWSIRLSVALTKAKKPGQKPFETDAIETVTKHLEDADAGQVTTALFMSPKQIELTAHGIASELKTDGKVKSLLKIAKAATVESLSLDAVDVALFGRMVAADSSLTVEGAAMFSHALSTHKADNDLDYFSAMEEFPKPDGDGSDAGAAMISTLEFSSAVYYRYAALNLGLLEDAKHLAKMTDEERKSVVNNFIRATVKAVPGARKNSMNANTWPSYVVGTFKAAGQPVQLVNAFERPVFAHGDISSASSREMLLHRAHMDRIYGLEEDDIAATGFIEPKPEEEEDRGGRKLEKTMIPDHLTLDEFCQRLTSHVQ